ncbi:hypothetical protein [Kitasatospora sp. NPDC093806]|uniref:WXG100 family type VII secretion target n=1 Tax=Kitasatospora sp. NPDC093806 TaxID=3155075 RepID=UPI00341F22D2
MAQALNPGEVMAAADPWRRAADTLKAIRATLTRASTEAATSWEGTTSDAFHTRMLHLATTINTTASYANDAANTLKAVSEAIAKAKRDMPEEPSGWEQLKDGVGDTFSSLFGADDEDARTDLANQKKLEAATVMQTLAMHYRTAAPMLKPPPPPPPPGQPPYKGKDEATDVSGAADSGAAAPLVSAMMAGSGYVGGGSAPSGTGAPTSRAGGTGGGAAPKVATVAAPPVASDPGIKGGVAQAAPKSPKVANYGPGVAPHGVSAGIDGMSPTPPVAPGSGQQGPNPGTSPNGFGPLGGPAPAGSGGAPQVGEGPSASRAFGEPGLLPGRATATGSGIPGKVPPGGGGEAWGGRAVRGAGEAPGAGAARGGGQFGAGAAFPGEAGVGGRGGAARPGKGTSNGPGHVGGEGAKAGGGPRQVFTEGGSGLGGRGRGRPEQAATSANGVGMGMPFGGAQQRGREKDGRGKRPDYLVEDEETWASDKPANPNVVE